MRRKLLFCFDLIITIFMIIGLWVMFSGHTKGDEILSTSGFRNFKYYTTLTNVFCGIVSLITAILLLVKKGSIGKTAMTFKLMAASLVGVTFLVVVLFLGPLYGHSNMYRGANLWFHLILPVTALIEFFFYRTEGKKEDANIPFSDTLKAFVPTIVYGLFYIFNSLINGIGYGRDTNDWYGFIRWGYPVGILIFAVIVAVNWGVACILRIINNRINRGGEE